MKMVKLFGALAALAAAAGLFASPAEAQRRCLVTATSAPSIATYDPFAPTGVNITNVAITFTRGNGPGGAKPSLLDFYIKSASAAVNGIQLIPTSVVGSGTATGLNQNIYFDTTETPPVITTPLAASPPPRVLRWAFTGNNAASDVFTINFTVIIPANIDLTASSNVPFDVEYGCDGTGGGGPFSERSVAPNAYAIQVTVKSALQASYVGAALDFGEVGNKTTAQVLADPATYTTPLTGNYVSVRSSGPYKIEMSSQNAYRLTFPGGNPATAVQALNYKVLFLGQTVSNLSSNFTAVTCSRAGVLATQADMLPIRATLLEGGDGKQVSPNYKDVITVTVSPLNNDNAGAPCP